MTPGFLDLAIVVFLAAFLGSAAKVLRQPLILAYLGVGVIIASFGFLPIAEHEVFRLLSDLGIMFLLFLVGLEINWSSLKAVGKTSLIVGLGQIVFTAGIGYLIALAFDFPALHAAYLGIALTFSSTVIVIKLLSEKKDEHSLYGKISIGILLVQDVVAIALLVVLAGFADTGGFEGGMRTLLAAVGLTAIKGIILFFLILSVGRRLMPHFLDRVARSRELLFLISLAWVFLVAEVVRRAGFSIEIGGFLAGLAFANSFEHHEISSRVRPLRDFFIMIFFVILGSSLVFSDFEGLIAPTIVFSLFVLVGNPLIVLILMAVLGYRKRTSFLTGVTVAQISEFSLILAALGERIGHLSPAVVSLVTAVGITTITLSTYLILYAERIMKPLRGFLALFERRRAIKDESGEGDVRKPIVLVGCHRIGESIALNLPKDDLLVIDFDPDVIRSLRLRGFHCFFGDIRDPDIIRRAHIEDARLVISTSPDLSDNLAFLAEIGLEAKRPTVVLRAEDERDAMTLYDAGADYVLLPHMTSGQYLGKTIALDPEAKILTHLKKRDIELLSRRLRMV